MNLVLLTTTLIAEIETNLWETYSSSCSSSKEDDDDMILVDIHDMLLHHTARVVADIEVGTEACTIKWRQFGGLLIQDVSEDDATAHFRFQKRHSQGVADKIWPRVQEYLVGGKMAVTYNSGNCLTHLVS
jgi:hypothetical protein